MSGAQTTLSGQKLPSEQATRVAVVAALGATTMLFASLSSAFLLRRSFADWRPVSAIWPLVLVTLAFAASAAVELVSRHTGLARRSWMIIFGLASAMYLASAAVVIVSTWSSAGGLGAPFNAFVVLLLGVHVVHSVLGGLFASWILRPAANGSIENRLGLARGVTHTLTALLLAIVFLLFGLR